MKLKKLYVKIEKGIGMKKAIFVILLIFLTILICIYMNYKQMAMAQAEAQKFNKTYEFYNQKAILGTDITTVINKAMDNNETYAVPKDEKNQYIPNETDSIKIYLCLKAEDKPSPMEEIVEIGLTDFTALFGELTFQCADMKYHEKTGKIAEMTFILPEY